MRIPESELILNADGSVFHLHLFPADLANKVILVGDPERVGTIAAYFDSIECRRENREFVAITGSYQNKRITVLSTGIGTDNIDIVMNELDALANIDFETRTIKDVKRSLEIVRIGTSGGMQADLPVDSVVMTVKSVGFDGLLNFYEGGRSVSDEPFAEAVITQLGWGHHLTTPYVVHSSSRLIDRFSDAEIIRGVTISAPGFYGPQGRELRLRIAMQGINDRIAAFRFNREKITNYEMESSAITGLGNLLGHQSVTICAIIANRETKTYSKDYKPVVHQIIKHVLDKF